MMKKTTTTRSGSRGQGSGGRGPAALPLGIAMMLAHPSPGAPKKPKAAGKKRAKKKC